MEVDKPKDLTSKVKALFNRFLDYYPIVANNEKHDQYIDFVKDSKNVRLVLEKYANYDGESNKDKEVYEYVKSFTSAVRKTIERVTLPASLEKRVVVRIANESEDYMLRGKVITEIVKELKNKFTAEDLHKYMDGYGLKINTLTCTIILMGCAKTDPENLVKRLAILFEDGHVQIEHVKFIYQSIRRHTGDYTFASYGPTIFKNIVTLLKSKNTPRAKSHVKVILEHISQAKATVTMSHSLLEFENPDGYAIEQVKEEYADVIKAFAIDPGTYKKVVNKLINDTDLAIPLFMAPDSVYFQDDTLPVTVRQDKRRMDSSAQQDTTTVKKQRTTKARRESKPKPDVDFGEDRQPVAPESPPINALDGPAERDDKAHAEDDTRQSSLAATMSPARMIAARSPSASPKKKRTPAKKMVEPSSSKPTTRSQASNLASQESSPPAKAKGKPKAKTSTKNAKNDLDEALDNEFDSDDETEDEEQSDDEQVAKKGDNDNADGMSDDDEDQLGGEVEDF